MLFTDVVAVSHAVASTKSRSAKTSTLAAALKRLTPAEAPVALSYLAGRPMQDRLGAGHATVYAVGVLPAAEPSLEILEVDAALREMAAASGPGSKRRRSELLTSLLARATEAEQEFIRGLILRNLRQGALDGVMADAVATALGVSLDQVRRATMLEGDLVTVASRALVEGPDALGKIAIAVFTPVQPMLAATASSAGEAVATLGSAIVERKLDGARIQVHREGGRVRVFSRNLRDITARVPEIAAAAMGFDAGSFILDGEALVLGPGGSPQQFQDSMSRFGADQPGERPALAAFYFDCLLIEDTSLIDEPLHRRRGALSSTVPLDWVVASIATSDPGAAERFFAEAVEAGYEGVVTKHPDLPYQAGRRGSGWLKVKPIHTLDLVVLAAEWGSGRRQGWLSNLHLGASDGRGGFVMLGKRFKGLSDEMLAWQTERFLAIEDRREGHVVHLKPEIVYEIAFDGVQRSTRYPGGVALRFARVRRHREDKTAAEADTIDTVRRFLGP